MTPADELRLAASTLRHPSAARLVLSSYARLALAGWLDAEARGMDRTPGIAHPDWIADKTLAAARAINGDQT